ncbi:MAG: flagellar hook protein FlgE [Deltaproteobacteria bacterium]|nr:flagellar hook protein FlgE [Deltaproteobacteria bacterium]
MAIFGALGTARSGLVATGAALSVIGNNIANVNTIGFKGSRTDFADLLSAQGGGGSAGKIGLGTRIGRISASFTQGNIESTGRPTDLAIEGNGFFVVGTRDGNLFTRAGNFRLDSDGNLVTSQGLPVQGFALNALEAPVGAPTNITVTGSSSQPVPTTAIEMKANLRADVELIPSGFDGTTFDTAYATSNFTTSINVFDSLGAKHTLNLFFTRTGANTWDYNVGVDAGDTGGTAGELSALGNGQLVFNPDGSLNSAPSPATVSVTFTGASAQTIDLDFGTPNTDPVANPGQGIDGITQFAGPSAVGFQSQNGYGAGQLLSLEFSEAGIVTGVFDNGQTRPLFQLALANFTAPDALTPLGNGLYRESVDSGSPAIGTPGSGGLGAIVAGAVELSNVAIAQEFIDLISTQRSFQANARVITSSDTLLNDLINIVR